MYIYGKVYVQYTSIRSMVTCASYYHRTVNNTYCNQPIHGMGVG